MLTNVADFPCAATAQKLIDSVLELPPPRHEPVTGPVSSADTRAGTYTDTAHVIEVVAEGGQLVVSEGDSTHRMTPLDPTTYVDDSDPDIVLSFHDTEAACTLRYPLGWITGYRNQPS